MIHIKNLNKYYHKGKTNEIHVIDNTTVTLEDKGLVCILGESGSGKTTLMNTVSGLDDFHDGEIEVDGVVIKKYGEKNQERVRNEKFGYIFQNYYLLQDRTVEYNLMLGLSLYDIPDEEKQERIDYVLRAVDMWKYKKRPVSQLSGGQQQRVAIARALAKSPKIIFADEPTGNLDEANTMRIMGILKKISEKCLVVVVTHEKAIADFFADRILWISDGTIQKDADRSEKNSYEYEEDTNIYLGEYEEAAAAQGNVKFLVYSEEPVPETHLRMICENGRIYLDAGENQEIVFLRNSDEKRMVEGKKPVVDRTAMESVEFSLPHIAGAKRPKMKAGEIMEIAKTNIKAFGKKQIFLILTLFLMSVLIVISMGNILSVMKVDRESLAIADSHYYRVEAKKDAMITDSEYKEYFSEMVTSFENAGLETGIVPVVTLTYQYYGYEQLENMSYTLENYSLVGLDKLKEEDVIYGRMPENDQEVVADQWVIENFIRNSPQVGNVMNNSSQAVGAVLKTSKNMEFEIVGICASDQASIYVDKDILVAMSSTYLNFMTDTKAGETFDGYTGGELGVDENGNVQVLVSEEMLQKKFREDMVKKYKDLETLHKIVEKLESQAGYAGTGLVSGKTYTADDAARELPYYKKELEKKIQECGITYEEYLQLLDMEAEDAAYKSYTYEGILTDGITYTVTGYFPSNYGVDYIISDDSCRYIAKSVMNNGKECYVYIEDNIGRKDAENLIRAAIPEEISQNLNVTIVNEYQKAMDAYETEKNQKIGTMTLLMATIFFITMLILYFMMKANAVTRMQDLGVYRMLGISKYSIIGMFAYENFLITTYTSLVGAVLTFAVTYVTAQIPSLDMEFYYPWYLFAITIAVIYLFNIFIGILPVLKMLRLPPAQLAAKYDF